MRRLAALLSCLAAVAAQASPTANEYLPCHQLGARYVQSCLDEAPGRPQPRCWTRARAAVDRCYGEVRDSHDRGKSGQKAAAQAAAEKEAGERRKAQQR